MIRLIASGWRLITDKGDDNDNEDRSGNGKFNDPIKCSEIFSNLNGWSLS